MGREIGRKNAVNVNTYRKVWMCGWMGVLQPHSFLQKYDLSTIGATYANDIIGRPMLRVCGYAI